MTQCREVRAGWRNLKEAEEEVGSGQALSGLLQEEGKLKMAAAARTLARRNKATSSSERVMKNLYFSCLTKKTKRYSRKTSAQRCGEVDVYLTDHDSGSQTKCSI